jgi:EAL domain-containing protein (putative c-di-GMP-specific phosphodiesterase class I)/GGDEF domain-containing protein
VANLFKDKRDDSGPEPSQPSDTAAPGELSADASAGHAVIVVSAEGKIEHVLQAPTISGQPAPQLVGRPIDDVWPGEPAGRLASYARRAIRSREVESQEIGLSSDVGHYEFIFIPTGPARVMIVARDVTSQKLKRNRLEQLAYYDETTKLPNQQYLMEELERCTDTLRLKEGRAAVLCFHMRPPEGGAMGGSRLQDLVFMELGSRLTHGLRGANNLQEKDNDRYSVAARIDYEQFAVILPEIENGAEAESVAERLVDTLSEPIEVGGQTVRITAHAGIALFPQDGTDAETLYSNARAAMEDASASKAPSRFHSGTLRLRTLQRLDLEVQLRTALETAGFSVEFLPVVAAETRKVVSVEALLRWPQDVFNTLSIREIVSVAEHTGLIRPIGDWVMRTSCQALKEWHEAGWPNLRLSVNLSVQEFSREDMAERAMKVLRREEIDPSFVDFEIDEYSLFRDAIKNYVQCRSLKDEGFGIVVDDYGTGACSLAHLSRSPVDAIKIDGSFVANVADSESDRNACAAVVSIAQKLGKRTIAESVETEDQADFLISQGCNFLQGFLTCRPTTVEGMHEVLAGRPPA